MATTDRDGDAERFDLTLTRVIDAPRALVWQAWTEPEHLRKWWAPAPLTTLKCEMDVRPGGVFRTLMRTPDGEDYPTDGVFLEVVEHERIVFTDVLRDGWRPAENPFFTAIVTFEERQGGTRYTARALHATQANRKRHEDMGFHQGWATCADQLAAVAVGLKTGA